MMTRRAITVQRQGGFKERAAQTRGLLQTISGIVKDAVKVGPDMLRLVRATWDIQARVDHIQNIGREERDQLKGALILQAVAAAHMKKELLKIAEEYENLARVTTPEHRQYILDAIGTADPEDIPRIRQFVKYVASAKKDHASTIMEKARNHGIKSVLPIAKAYYHGSPEEKEAIAHILRHVANEEHVERAKYHVSQLKNIHEGIKKQLPRLLSSARDFNEVDRIIMAAHHASQSIRAGGREEDILKAFKDKETAMKQFSMPAKGWEPYASRAREIR